MLLVDYICDGKLVSKGKLSCPNCGKKSSEMKEAELRQLLCPCGLKFEADQVSLRYRNDVLAKAIIAFFVLFVFLTMSIVMTYFSSRIQESNTEEINTQIEKSNIKKGIVTEKLIESGIITNRVLKVNCDGKIVVVSYVSSNAYYQFELKDSIWLRIYEGEVKEISDHNEWSDIK